MAVLIVTSYPPMACGIGKYAEQQAAWLRRRGRRVDVFSPPEGGGDWRGAFDDGWLPLRVLRAGWAYRDIIIHFTPHFFYKRESVVRRWVTSIGFLILMIVLGRRVTFMIHETEYRMDEPLRPGKRSLLDRWWWRLAGHIIFHSEAERNAFADYYRLDRMRRQFVISPHEKYMVPRCEIDRAEARRRLALDPDAILMVSLGFIQPHKGFDRVFAAMKRVDCERLRYMVVGSVRIAWDVAHNYAQHLREMADEDPRCDVIETYLSDELFDMWMIAADYVVIPYREIWSSSVAARAKLLNRPAIAANTGGLAEQLAEGSMLFNDDEELAAILGRVGKQCSEIRD